MRLTDRSIVTISPYDARILGRRTAASAAQKYVGYIHQLHTHLVPDPRAARTAANIGGDLVQIAGAILCLLVPTGFLLWWRSKRARIKWTAPWYRISFDLHQTAGVYAALALMILALTGVLIGQEQVFYSLTHSPALTGFPSLQSAPSQSPPITVDRAGEIARAALPHTTVTEVMLPENPRGFFAVVLRTPEETSEAAHSYVFIDQYSGRVLHVRDFLTNSPGYRAVRFNRSIHTGDVWGATGHILAAIASLVLALMAITGLIIWIKKLAI